LGKRGGLSKEEGDYGGIVTWVGWRVGRAGRDSETQGGEMRKREVWDFMHARVKGIREKKRGDWYMGKGEERG